MPRHRTSKFGNDASSLAEKAKQTDLTNYIKSKIQTAKIQRSNFLLFDSFIRADSATSIGSAETNNTAYTVLSSGTSGIIWGVSSNYAYVASKTSNGRGLAYQEMNESDGTLEVDMSGINGADGGIGFRITDVDNFFYACVQGSNNSINLFKYVAGTRTTIKQYYPSYSLTDGKLSVLMKGNKIEVYYDGFLMLQAYDSFNNTATKHGLFSSGANLNYRWKNFCVKPLGIIPYYIDEKFETSLSKWYWYQESAGLSYSQTFSSTIKESGNTSLRMELHKDDPDVSGSKRCEIKLREVEKPLEEHWYGVSIYLPNGGDEDFAYDDSAEVLVQWHETPDYGASETDISPPLALVTEQGKWKVWQAWDSGRVSTNNTRSLITTDLGSYEKDKGRWVQWVFHIRWGFLDIHEPITEIYKDGVMVYSSKSPNTYNDQLGIYFKLGIYKWDWKYNYVPSLLTKRVTYYDNLWIK